ncbi:putative recombination initiation defects 3 [Citrus sinensis]|uniref:Recombination initiation defects 3 n=1 Tax=Citrus sinensis TaxID=2711 RepID=A0ACB8MQL6_CITSI|nr:putative recombination initiation defects 3 [Citrus sinensis]KAH9732646.1 putative recombination initiation defects 3 [Citrus sinensis]KAH9787857.1 putative recombination initiation defects 3 [Citrus sinensis]
MKLKINKATDLSSISVLPPHARRSFGPQPSQLRSQPSQSQQSFSQGPSSQLGMFSQLSQSSLDEVLTNEQRVSSQERENTVKKFSCLPPGSYTREDSQTPIRCSTNVVRKWNPASAPDQRCQVSEELERRLGLMETSLNRIGINLDSVQSDIMQVNRGSKEILLEVEGISQKLIVQDTSLQLMLRYCHQNKGQEDIKTGLDGGLKSLSDQLGKDIYEDKFKEIFLELSSLPKKIEASLLKLQNELFSFLTEQMKASQISQNAFKFVNLQRHGHPATFVPSKKPRGRPVSSQKKLRAPKKCVKLKLLTVGFCAVKLEANVPEIQVANVDMGGWTFVKKELATLKKGMASEKRKQKGVSCVGQAKECIITIDSDEDINGGFSCLINEKETGNKNKLIHDEKEATERILRKARRRKRKYDNAIIIN